MILRIEASKEYDVVIQRGSIKSAGETIIKYISPCKVLIVTDDNVDRIYSGHLEKSLSDTGFIVSKYVIAHGEKSKNIDTFSDILNYMADLKMTRGDIIVALGGGVTGDLSGFAAASYMRGIRFIQIPTTFLAAIDSSVGGKTGINLKNGKNLAGAFWQPSLVLCDCDTFNTLSRDIFSDGVAEAIKAGIIADEEVFSLFENGTYIDKIDSVVASCIEIKGTIVKNDEFENGCRRLLNLGHTVGHAVEKCSNYSITHGHAVSIGISIVLRATYKLNYTNKETCDRIINTLKKCGLPTSCSFSAQELTDIILNDKKRIRDNILFVIPKRIGHCIVKEIEVGGIFEFISSGL